MSKKKTNLEDFLDSYIKNREIKNRALSYGDYLRNTNGEYKSGYYKGRLSAAIDRKSADRKYGASRESLASSGLIGSGYAEHLKSLTGAKYKSSITSLDEQLKSNEAKAKSGYYKYLSDYDASQTALKGKVLESLIGNEVINTDEAYDYAISAGLAPEAAAATSQSAHNEVRKRLRLKVISDMFKRELSPELAADYARELGLGDEDAEDLAKIAEKYRNDFDGFSKEYLEYLESVGNKTTGTYP